MSFPFALYPFGTALDANGDPMPGGKLYIKEAEGDWETDLVLVYSDTDGTTTTNPIVADSAGRFPAYFLATGTYDFGLFSPDASPPGDSPVRTALSIAVTDITDEDLADWAQVSPDDYYTAAEVDAAFQPLDSQLTLVALSPQSATLDTNGQIAPAAALVIIDTFGSAAEDNLESFDLTNISTGDRFTVRISSASRKVTIKDGVSISTRDNRDIRLTTVAHQVTFMRVGSAAIEIDRTGWFDPTPIYNPDEFEGATAAARWTAMLTAIEASASSGAIIELEHGKVYTDPLPSTTSDGVDLTTLKHLEIRGNGATLNDTLAYTDGQYSTLAVLDGVDNITIRDLTLLSQENAHGETHESGPRWFWVENGSANIALINVHMSGGFTPLYLNYVDSLGAGDEPMRVLYENLTTYKVGRPILVFGEGAQIIARNCSFNDSGRDVFIANPRHFDLEYTTTNFDVTSALIIAEHSVVNAEGRCIDGRLRVSTGAAWTEVPGGTLVQFVCRTGSAGNPVDLSNIHVHFDADMENGDAFDYFLVVSSQIDGDDDLDYDNNNGTTGYGHEVKLLTFSGIVRNAPSGTVAQVTDGTFGTSGTTDVLSQISFKDFRLEGNAAANISLSLAYVPDGEYYLFERCHIEGTVNGGVFSKIHFRDCSGPAVPTNLNGYQVAIADDGFVQVPIPAGWAGEVAIMCRAWSFSGRFHVDNVPGRALTTINKGANVEVYTSGALNGTTDDPTSDGKVYVALHTDDYLYVQNRSGASVKFVIALGIYPAM